MTRPAHRLVWSPAFQVVHILFSGLCYRHCPNRFSVSPRMLALTVLRSYGPVPVPHAAPGSTRYLPTRLLTKTADDPYPLLVLPLRVTPVQVRARFPSAGPVAAMPATRRKAVTPTATAPTTEKMICQVSDGIMCLTIPSVA